MKRIFIFILMVGSWHNSFSQQTIKRDISAAYIAPKGASAEFKVSSGAFFFDATKRMGISNIYQSSDGKYVFKYLAEEQPDAVYETIKEFLISASASLKKSDSIDASAYSSIISNVEKLTVKSYSLNFLRSSLYRLNEVAFNDDIQEDSYVELYKLIIKETSVLQQKEIELEGLKFK